jgi:predicted dehydrogenase
MNRVISLAEPAQALPPSLRKVKIGIVGLNFGRTIINQILDPVNANYFDLTALCDINETCLQSARPASAVCLYSKLDDILQDDQVEAIGLFTGPTGRAELVRKIIESGRHVITTKPLEYDAEAMLKILRRARHLGRVVHCNSPSPLPSQDLRVIQRWIHEYDLGRPVGAHADVWVSYREKEDGSWYDDPIRCPAAPIYRLGIYLINDLVRLWGPVEKVQIMQSQLFTQRPTSDNAHLGLFFKNKALATVYASFCVKDGDHYRNSLTLNFENGSIYRNAGPAWSASANGHCHLALVKEHKNQPQVVAKETVTNQSGNYQWEYFARKIRGETHPEELTPEETVEGIRVIQSMSEVGTHFI